MAAHVDRKKQAYDYLREKIISGELKPGSPLVETDIALELEMSRTPIREAMRMLEADGLVTSYPFRGVFVSEISQFDIEEIYELRILLEEWALRKSINRITPEELDQVEQEWLNVEDWSDIHEADVRLHALFINKSGSKRVKEILNTFNGQLELFRRIGTQVKERRTRTQGEHLAIIEAIRDGDPENACRVLRKHLESVEHDIIKAAKMYEAGK